MKPSLRRAEHPDLAGILRLYSHLNPSDPVPATGEVAERWEAIVASDMVHVIVAEEAGSLVSTCMLAILPNLTRKARAIGIIENVVTDPACRRRGLGTSVLGFALKMAREANCYKVMLATGSRDEATLKFYEKAGFARGNKTHFEARMGS